MSQTARVLLVALTGLATLLVASSPSLAYSDVGARYATAINALSAQGVIQGYADGTFRPNALINRAEFTKIIIAGQHPSEDMNSCLSNDMSAYTFRDVPTNSWYWPYLCVATAPLLDGIIIQGYSDNTFRPSQNINFVEAAKILALSVGYDTWYDRFDEQWFSGYVHWLAAHNAIPKTIQSFDYMITREDMAEMYYRLKNNVTDQPSFTYQEVEQGMGKMLYEMHGLVPDTLPAVTTPSSNSGTFALVSSDENVTISEAEAPGCGEPQNGMKSYSGTYSATINGKSISLGSLYFGEGTSFDREITSFQMRTLTNQPITVGIVEQYDTCNGNTLTPVVYYAGNAAYNEEGSVTVGHFADYDNDELIYYSAQEYGVEHGDHQSFFTLSYDNSSQLWYKSRWGVWDGVLFRMERLSAPSKTGPWTSLNTRTALPFL